MKPLRFPALIRFGNKLVACDERFLKVDGARVSKDGRLSIGEPLRIADPYRRMIDANGKFRRFKEISRKRRTPQWLKPLINFDRIIYEVTDPVDITIEELLKVTKGGKSSIRKEFKKLATQKRSDEVLTQEEFLHDCMYEKRDVEISEFP